MAACEGDGWMGGRVGGGGSQQSAQGLGIGVLIVIVMLRVQNIQGGIGGITRHVIPPIPPFTCYRTYPKVF